VINFFFKLLQERDNLLSEGDKSRKKSHFFNSFFITKLLDNGYNYSNVKRWTRAFDLFSLSKVFCPVNLQNMHWLVIVGDQEGRGGGGVVVVGGGGGGGGGVV